MEPVCGNVRPVEPGVKPPREGMAKPRMPFEVDISGAVKPGDNVLALRPVLLIAK